MYSFPEGAAPVRVSPAAGASPSGRPVARNCSIAGGGTRRGDVYDDRWTIHRQREDTVWRLSAFSFVGIAPDGRFLIANELPGQTTRLQIVVNWLGKLALQAKPHILMC